MDGCEKSILGGCTLRSSALVWFLAGCLRIIAWLFCSEFLSNRAELVVPQNSFRRLADGISLQASGISPYDGDMFHNQPIILNLFFNIADKPRLLIILFLAMDIAISETLRRITLIYLGETKTVDDQKKREISSLVVKCYLLNPISVASCSIFSLSVLNNFFICLFIYAFVKGWLVLGAVLCAFICHLALYPAVFICVLIIRAETLAKRLSLVLVFVMSLGIFIGVNYLLIDDPKFLDSTYMFMLDVRDLTPNVGIFWYFFIEVFNHFRLFFLWVFHVNFLIYVFPLLLTVRSDSFLLLHLYLILISVFSSYPSMADSLIYLSLLPVFYLLHRHIRWGLLISGTLVTCTVLASIMSIMWIVIGSANANFYFAVALAYSVAQIFLLTDLLYAYLHKKVAEDRGPEKMLHCECFALK